MLSRPPNTRFENTRRELLGLLLASLACVVVLTVTLVERPSLSVGGIEAQVALPNLAHSTRRIIGDGPLGRAGQLVDLS